MIDVLRFTALAAFGVLCVTPAKALETKKSVYTRHVYSKCPATHKSADGVDYRTCLGVGVNLFWTGESDGSSISFGRSPIKESLDLAPFIEVGDNIEWRSTAASNGTPVAAIVRYRIGQRVGALNQSRLVVYRLEPSGKSCVMGVVKEPGANDKARAMADGDAEKFRCGSDKRIER